MAGTSRLGVWESLTIEIGNQATKFHIDHVVQMCGHHKPFFFEFLLPQNRGWNNMIFEDPLTLKTLVNNIEILWSTKVPIHLWIWEVVMSFSTPESKNHCLW